MDREQQKIDRITARLTKHVSQEKLDKLNEELASSKLNLQVDPVNISPSQKFANNAAVLNTAIQLLSGSVTGINFAPCVFSASISGIGASFLGTSFNPHLIDIEPAVSSMQAYGINLQPAMLSVTPNGTKTLFGLFSSFCRSEWLAGENQAC